jgi:hypothetical protein
MDFRRALAFVLDGASMEQIAADRRDEHLAAIGKNAGEVDAALGADEVAAFMRAFARFLGDRHAGNPRVGHALREWVRQCDHYEAWDALLTGFAVEGRQALVRRGRFMFPGTLTAHWAES